MNKSKLFQNFSSTARGHLSTESTFTHSTLGTVDLCSVCSDKALVPIARPISRPTLQPAQCQHEDNSPGAGGTQVITRPEEKTKTPSMYKVILLNDDFTPMDFVVHILQKFFKKTTEEASHVMMQVHTEGAGVAGVYSFEIAETKAFQVNEYSKSNQHPLKCSVERA